MNSRLHLARPQLGVTLIEACVVLAITAVVAASVMPGMQTLIGIRRLDGAATELATDIQFARAEAVARNESLRLSVHGNGNGTSAGTGASTCYLIHTGSAADCSCISPGPAQCTADAQVIKTVVLSAADGIRLESNAASIVFDPLHGTSTPTATLRLSDFKGRAVHHVVNVMGRARSCSPSPAMTGYRAC